MGLSAPAPLGRRRRRGGVFRVAQLFANGEAGAVYDPSDLTPEKVAWRRNLLTWSEDFTNAVWNKNGGTTVSTGFVSPAGDTSAQKIIPAISGTTNGISRGGIGILGGAFSFYAKAAEITSLTGQTGTGDVFTVNLTTGAFSGSTATRYVNAQVLDVGNGWWRVSWTRGTDNDPNVFINGASGIGGSNGFLLWGMQTENNPTATAYQRITDFTSDFLAVFPTHTLFQDSAGTTPVTALGQPVGRVLDISGRGNHAIQATSASRPLLDARVNLLTYSDEFDNVIWTKISSAVTVNTTVAPDGTTTADTLTATAGAGFHYLNTGLAFLAASYTYTLHVKKGTSRWIFFGITDTALNYFDLDTGLFGTTPATCAATDLGNGWWRLTATATQTAGSASGVNVGVASGNGGGSFTATGTETVIIWRSDLRLTTDAAYPPQRVAAATDYADVGAPRSFAFDGVDDFLVTAANMDLSGTDKVTVFAGARKNSDATIAVICEHTSASTTDVLFAIFAPRANATANYSFRSRGTTTTVDATSPSTFAAPGTHVLTGQADTGAPLTSLRINGTEQATSATVQGVTNYRADLLYIGRRFNATVPFNGKLYQLIVRGALTDAGTLVQAERYVAQRTGITL